MFFPIGDNNIVRGHKPLVTYLLILVNVAVFLFEVTLPSNFQAAFMYDFGSIPAEINHGVDLNTLFTCMFLHGGWMHLIGNMLFLWVFADNIEATIGSFRFLLFYLAGGIIASLTHSVLSGDSQTPCVGASGAIAATLGAYLVMFPGSRVRVLFLLMLTSFRVPAIFFLGFWILQQFLSGIGSFGAPTSDTSGIAYWAHIGGFVFGFITGFFYRNKAGEMELE